MGEKRNDELGLFGFSLDQTSTVILFYLSIVFLTNSLFPVYNYILDFIDMLSISSINDLIINLIGSILFLIKLTITLYILFFCLKTRDKYLIDRNNAIDWFGFRMNRTSATVLFFLSLFGLMVFFIGIYGWISITFYSFNRFLDLSGIFFVLMPIILILIEGIFLALINGYTIYKCLLISKRARKEMVPSTGENINSTKFFRFELNNTSASIIFIETTIGTISSCSIIFIYIFDFTLTINLSDLFSNLLFFTIPLIILGFYIYPLFCCLKFRKTHLNDTTEGVRWFEFEMNKTSACILYVMSILGIISFLNAISEFIGNMINILRITDNLEDRYLINNLIRYPIANLITDIVFVLIYIYTFRKSIKVRNLMI